MARALVAFLTLSLFISACTQRLICPAYQSAFIYDKEALRKKFSYFQEDSTPKVYTASKNKYLIAEPVSYRKKIRSMQTVSMKDVNPVLPDSLKEGYDEALAAAEMGEDGVVPGAELDLAARSVIDSIYIEDVPQDTTQAVEEDSVYMISKDKEIRLLKYDFPDSLVYDSATGKYASEVPHYAVTEIRFNVEQDNYMWYLRDYLVLPDVRLASQPGREQASGGGTKEGKKEKKGGFFKNLFKKKQKEEVDSAELAPPAPAEEEFDYVDEDEQLKPPAPQEEVKEKKGLFGRKKKAEPEETVDDQAAPADEKPAKKKKEKKEKKKKSKKDEPKISDGNTDDEDDGF
jgi:hypothetical protein